MKMLLNRLLVLLFVVNGVNQVQAASPADANIPRGETIAPVPPVVPSTEIQQNQATPQPSDTSIRLTVEQFKIKGNQSIADEALLAILTPYQHQEIGMAELNQAIQQITQYYRDRGYFLAQAYLPTQEIKQGIVEIAVLEGQLGQLSVSEADGMNQAFIVRMAQYRFDNQAVVTERNLVRNVTLINSLPAMRATASLNPGEAVGSSDVVIELEPLPSNYYVALNNYGNRFTGREQLLAGGSLRNFAGVGDVLNMNLKHATNNGQNALQLSYISPIHASGTMFSTYYSYVDYELSGAFSSLDADGNGHYLSAYLDQPFYRSATTGILGRFGARVKKIKDEVGTAVNQKRDVASLEFGLLGDWIVPNHRSVYQWGATITTGDVRYKDDAARAVDAATVNTEGGFSKLNLNISRQQFFDHEWRLTLNADYQLANKNLDSVEKLAIGGINRWRAYAALPNQADTGLMLNAEVRKGITMGEKLAKAKLKALSPYVFVDYGHGKSNQNPITDSNNIITRQFGMGVDMLFEKDWSVNAVLTTQERALEDSKDEQETKFWLQLQKIFNVD